MITRWGLSVQFIFLFLQLATSFFKFLKEFHCGAGVYQSASLISLTVISNSPHNKLQHLIYLYSIIVKIKNKKNARNTIAVQIAAGGITHKSPAVILPLTGSVNLSQVSVNA